MTDYIDRDAVMQALADYVWNSNHSDLVPAPQWNHAVDIVRDFPAADVVEVVRCKDCKHSYDSMGGWCCSYGVCVDCIVPEDFFCKDGERKEDEG